MNKKVIIIAVIVVVVAVFAALMFFGSSDLKLSGGNTYVTVPGNYTLDDQGVAYSGDVGIFYTGLVGTSAKEQKKFFEAIKDNGKDSGYKKISKDKVNGFKLFEYSANPDKLKTVSTNKKVSGSKQTWKEFEPYMPFKDATDMKVKKFRYVGYINEDTGDVSELYIFTNNTDIDLYSSDMAKIVNSISLGDGK